MEFTPNFQRFITLTIFNIFTSLKISTGFNVITGTPFGSIKPNVHG
jgi:hypothetical protein